MNAAMLLYVDTTQPNYLLMTKERTQPPTSLDTRVLPVAIKMSLHIEQIDIGGLHRTNPGLYVNDDLPHRIHSVSNARQNLQICFFWEFYFVN